MNEADRQAFLSAVRAIMAAAGGWAVGKGYLSNDIMTQLLTIITLGAPFVWGIAQKYFAEREAQKRETKALNTGVRMPMSHLEYSTERAQQILQDSTIGSRINAPWAVSVVALLVALACAPLITGCVVNPNTQTVETVAPRGLTQGVYTAEVSLTAATVALVNLNKTGVVTGDLYATAYGVQQKAHALLLPAREAAVAKEEEKGRVYLAAAHALIDQLGVYIGGKK